jgi:hypothetical protein
MKSVSLGKLLLQLGIISDEKIGSPLFQFEREILAYSPEWRKRPLDVSQTLQRNINILISSKLTAQVTKCRKVWPVAYSLGWIWPLLYVFPPY